MLSASGWGLARRVGFRCGVIVGGLLVFPFPLGVIPKTEIVATWLARPFQWATSWLAGDVFGLQLSDPAAGFAGSGDRAVDYVQVLLIAALGVLGTLVWSIADRRRRSYPRLAAAALVVGRYYLAYMMLTYGISKLLKSQFYDLSPSWLHERLGDGSPMRMLWAFMGYSLPYTVFAGLAETAGGLLLLWRRTATLGAVLVVAVMTNVVMLNLCYDVPVKLFATELLIMGALIARPGARRMIAAALGHAVAELPPRVRMAQRRERIRVAAKLGLIAAMAVNLYLEYHGGNRNDHVHELYGNWEVDQLVADGVERPPLTTDPVRWQTLSINARSAVIWLMTGTREPSILVNRGLYDWKVDAASHTIALTLPGEPRLEETWHYSRPAPDRLVIDGPHGGKSLHVVLHLVPDPLLMTRGFHWINEVPFNR
jgi:uncharacterized membrane protein YphA (DoxX/SURF4 family)